MRAREREREAFTELWEKGPMKINWKYIYFIFIARSTATHRVFHGNFSLVKNETLVQGIVCYLNLFYIKGGGGYAAIRRLDRTLILKSMKSSL